ncbi:hypothetical protein NDU88_005588 [Pleurodeles waltl]|uniref:Uncharacterized protein n=1 Tax=Pleurodeles waltl TaxID=8319 RepID=A0AAV7QLF2_PLEWA|nr:hypothetical protein NDU88_005588 [Pleurodeles waltl]
MIRYLPGEMPGLFSRKRKRKHRCFQIPDISVTQGQHASTKPTPKEYQRTRSASAYVTQTSRTGLSESSVVHCPQWEDVRVEGSSRLRQNEKGSAKVPLLLLLSHLSEFNSGTQFTPQTRTLNLI